MHEDLAPKFVPQLKEIFEKASKNLGKSPQEMETEHGPVVDQQQLDKIMSYIEIGKDTAQLITGGTRKGSQGCFINPTIFLNPKHDSPIWKEEIFGPVLSIRTFRSEDEVIAMANDSTYGLAACIYTTDLTRALRVAGKLESGGVSINTPHLPSKNTPFGGIKQSGYGRELGKHGLLSYLEAKTIHIKYVVFLFSCSNPLKTNCKMQYEIANPVVVRE